MKKFSVVLAIAALATGFVSCTAQSPKADLKTDIDTLSYSIGMANTQGLKEYMVNQLGVDSAYVDEFIKGVLDGTKVGEDKKKNAYYAGVQIGQQVGGQMLPSINQQVFANDSTQSLSNDNFLAGFIDGIKGKTSVMTLAEADANARAKMKALQQEQMMKKYGANLEAGNKFLAEVAQKEGVQKLDGGVLYEVLTAGTGEVPADTSRVKVNYRGTLIDGTEFDSSYGREEPTKFRADQVIKGWTTVLTHMPVGSKWKVYIPQDQAYGEREAGQIKPFSALIFEIELVAIEK